MAATSDLPGPGKTSPRLLSDLYLHDPMSMQPRAFNILASPAPQYKLDEDYPDLTGPTYCKHILLHKPHQGTNSGLAWRNEIEQSVAAYCSECRCHFDITVRAPSSFQKGPTCPNDENPLHHWTYSPNLSESRFSPSQIRRTDWTDRRVFECSNGACCAAVTIDILPPRLNADDVFLLTDRATIRVRAQAHMNTDRELTVPEPSMVLSTLSAYIRNAMMESPARRIPALNRRFLPAFGDQQCGDLLNRLGFEFQPGEEEYWAPPQLQSPLASPLVDPQQRFLDDVMVELQQLISQRPWAETSKTKVTVTRSMSATKSIETIMGCAEYPKRLTATRSGNPAARDHPYYGGLGVISDVADTVLAWAHGRQRACDPMSAAYYFECLVGLAGGRGSSDLDTSVAMMRSEGAFTTIEIQEAYKYFNIISSIPEDSVIGSFQARIQDSPRQETEAREQLRIIGQARGSDHILQMAAGTITNYQQALSWLGASTDTPDEFIIVLVGIKVSDNKSLMTIATDAVKIIAEERHSDILASYLATGEIGAIEMDIGEAYNRLGISDRTVDDELILTTYDIRTQENPADMHNLKAALKAIAKEKKSSVIDGFLTGKPADQYNSSWPVGLENIGNTCYLNSLLQFYYTVKPLRDLVFNIDGYLAETVGPRKQVGGRKVSRDEVERAQRFVRELQKLFHSLHSEQKSAITPETELARLTLLSSSNEEQFRRMSMASTTGPPTLEFLNGVPVFGPAGPPELATTTGQPAPDMDIDTSSTLEDGINDAASDDTLIGDTAQARIRTPEEPPNYDDPDYIIIDDKMIEKTATILEDKENNAPLSELPHSAPVMDHQPLGVVTDSQLNQQNSDLVMSPGPIHDDTSKLDSAAVSAGMLTPPASPSPIHPDRAPPVPPRNEPAAKSKPKDELEFGAQQDVTEVISNVLFQLECAIRPVSIDKNGEQIDEIKDWFYGKSKSFVEMKDGTRVIEEFFSDIKIDVASGSRDIYAALDAAFEEQTIELEGTTAPLYSSISKLPPILQIQVQRVQFDAAKKTLFKSESYLELKERIFMDRYCDRKDLYPQRERAWKLKAEIAVLEERKKLLNSNDLDISKTDLLEVTNEFLVKSDELLPVAEGDATFLQAELSEALTTEAAAADAELSRLDAMIASKQAEHSGLFSAYQSFPYRLQSVFIHRGSVSFGHYWIYIYDFEQNIWRKYNDSYVTEIKDLSEIFGPDESRGSKATSYFLVYVREDQERALVGSVYRQGYASEADEMEEQEEGFSSTKLQKAPAEDISATASLRSFTWAGHSSEKDAKPSKRTKSEGEKVVVLSPESEEQKHDPVVVGAEDHVGIL